VLTFHTLPLLTLLTYIPPLWGGYVIMSAGSTGGSLVSVDYQTTTRHL